MKKILLLLFILPFVVGCSDDDDKKYDTKVSYTFNASSLTKIDDAHTGMYYLKLNTLNQLVDAVYLPVIEQSNVKGYGAVCPNQNVTHSTNDLLTMGENNELVCPKCGAEFDVQTGNAKNDIAKGYGIYVFDVSYDAKEKTYYVVYKK